MSDLIETLRLACDDPMWADHVEMPKKLLRHSIDYLSALKKQVEELTKALEPFVALADKRDAHYRRRGGNCDNFPDTHPSYDIDAGKRELPMGAWRAARAALASTRETSDAG